jgi:hypothetical protein
VAATKTTNSTSPFSPAEHRRYAELRFPGHRFNGHRAQVYVPCPFHNDAKPSLSFNFDQGTWYCHAGCGSGGILAFEEKFSHCDHETARANVSELLGRTLGACERRVPEAIYEYPNAIGRLALRKLRYPNKNFVWQRLAADGKTWINGLGDIEPPLYREPELVRSTYAILVEGEKDADRVRALNLSQYDPAGLPVAVTCNCDGAGPRKWKQEYGRHFTGKQVTVFGDNDPPGEAHALAAAAGIYPHAAGVKIVRLPGLREGGDVSDWLDAGLTVQELLAEIKKAPQWRLPDTPPPSRFHSIAEITRQSAETDWIVKSLIALDALHQLGGKIKSGKTSLEMALCKAVLTGSPFLNQPTHRGPVVMISEMNGSALTAALTRGGLLGQTDMRIMPRCDTFGLTWSEIVPAAVAECQRIGAILLVVDTLNGLCGLSGDTENSSGGMLEIMKPLQEATGRGFGILYAVHERKSGGDVADASRGSSATGGVADVLMSLRKPEGNHSQTIRKISSISRFPETPAEIVIDWIPSLDGSDGSYTVLGDSDAVSFDRATALVMRALPNSEGDAKTIEVLKADTAESETTIRRVLKDLGATKCGSGKKGNPVRFYQRVIGDEK